MRHYSRKGFTLIEVLVVLVIIGVLSTLSYVPYNHYSQISRLRVSEDSVRRLFEDAKLLSKNGQLFPDNINPSNADIGVFLKKWSPTIEVWIFRHGKPTPTSLQINNDAQILKKIKLEDGIQVNTINSTDDSVLIMYTAPKWEVRMYRIAPFSPITASMLSIWIWYKTALREPLYKEVSIRP